MSQKLDAINQKNKSVIREWVESIIIAFILATIINYLSESESNRK